MMSVQGLLLIGILFFYMDSDIIFVDVSEQAGITAPHHAIWDESAPGLYENGYLAAGTAWSDYDNDGWVDVLVTGNLAPNVLYHNNQDGTFSSSEFSDQLSLPDVPSGGAVWADYDNDGWRDVYILNLGANRLFRNLKGTGFEDVTLQAGVGDIGKATTAAWGDYDLDGNLDLYVTNWSCTHACELKDFSHSKDTFYRNNGDGTFTDMSGLLTYEKLLGAGFAVSFVDYDNDRDLDIYVVNDKAVNAIGNVLWRNDGKGCHSWCWTDVSAETNTDSIVHGMGLATGDYDNDGDLDFYFSNMVRQMVLLNNQGDGTYADATRTAGVDYVTGDSVGWGTAFFDYDNDGWLDLYLTATGLSPIYGKAGMHYEYPDMLYHNNHDGTFTALDHDLFSPETKPTMGFSTADYDNDGRVDYLLTYWDEKHRLFRNQHQNDHNWIAFSLMGQAPLSRDPLGTRVIVITDDGLQQMRELKSGSSLGAGNDLTLHFGLGDAQIDQVIVEWLNGQVDSYGNLGHNQHCQITLAAISCQTDMP